VHRGGGSAPGASSLPTAANQRVRRAAGRRAPVQLGMLCFSKKNVLAFSEILEHFH
jgi:hypothetical protein